MSYLKQASVWGLIWIGLWMPALRGASIQTLIPNPPLLAECPDLAPIVEGERWRDSLINPVFRTRAEVRDAALSYRRALECLISGTRASPPSDSEPVVAYHLELFLAFAEATAGSASVPTDLVDFRLTADPAVRRLREQLGLAPPEGLVFVRYFSSRAQMPVRIRTAFEDPDTRAVTIGARYIAVLAPSGGSLPGTGMIEDSLQATLSHEFVHAFLNARLDWSQVEIGFPSWFHEGMAIYFSGSGRRHLALDPPTGQLLSIAPTVEYEQYERVFSYLESDLGVDRFLSVLRSAVEAADASIVLVAADAESYEALHLRAERWWRWWPIPLAWTSGLGIVILTGLLVPLILTGWFIWRHWEPAIAGSALEVQLNRDLADAVRRRDALEVRDLLRSGADPDTMDSGESVLTWAVWLDDVDVAERLLESGAIVTSKIRQLADQRSASGTMVRLLADATIQSETIEN